jgi:hypothetical protein
VSFNGIESLDGGVFYTTPLLEVLVMTDNRIKSVHPEVFHGLKNLRKVDLRNNNIHHMHPGVFEHNRNLTILDLSCNDLSQLQLHFSFNAELKFLNLSVNKLKFEDLSIFRPLIHLQILDLSNNQMENVSAEGFYGMKDLGYLNVSGNPQLEYDCRLRTLRALCQVQSITCVTDDEQSFKMVDNLHCGTEEQPIALSLTEEKDGYMTVSEGMTEGSVDEGSGMEPTEIFVDNGVTEFNSTDKAFSHPTMTADDDWIIIAIIVVVVCCVTVVIIVAVICIRRHRNSRAEAFGNLSRTISIDYINQQVQFGGKHKSSRSDKNENHNNYDRVYHPDFSNSVLQFKVGGTVAAEVVRVPSFKTRGVAAPLNLPEEIPLRETKFVIENKREVCKQTNQPSIDCRHIQMERFNVDKVKR